LDELKIDIGCGNSPREGYTGVDIVSEAPGVKIADVTQGLPFADNSVSAVWSSHFLEHLGFQQILPLMGEIRRVLRPGGRVEIAVPDLEYVCRLFVEAEEGERWGWPIMTIFGHQQGPGEFHKTGFTGPKLVQTARQAGLRPLRLWKVWMKNQESLLLIAEK
jgi:SAM-dependent methyltransferase